MVLELLSQAVARAGYRDTMAFALDCASSEMYDADTDSYELLGHRVGSDELIDFTRQLAEDFPLVLDWGAIPRRSAPSRGH